MIDWEAVHRRLAQLEASLSRGDRRTAAETRLILRERAQILARPIAHGPAGSVAPGVDGGERFEFLEFTVGGERYGIETAHVREVATLSGLTRVPGVPAFVGGIGIVRGQVLSVLDLGRLFGLPEQGRMDHRRLVVLDGGEQPMGVLAATIVGVRVVSPGAIEAAPPTVTGGRAPYLRGVEETGVAILDGAALLAAQDLVVGGEAGR